MKKEKKLLDYDFILRPYPHSEDEVKICKHIQKNNLKNFKISKKSLKKDIKKCFAVIFSGTSAGIEAVNHGRVGIWSNLSNVGINPLFNNVENFLPNSNASQFRKKIEFLNKMKMFL